MQALQVTKEKRDAGYRFVTMVSNGWSKAGRAGRPRKNDRLVTNKDR